MANVWIVFHWQIDSENEGHIMPCVVGVFDDEALAISACTTDEHYVFPMTTNAVFNGEPVSHPGAYYPLADWKNQLLRKAHDGQ
jgi:hypothetical protein